MQSELSDKDILEMFATDEGKNFAFGSIVKKYQERIYWHVRKMVLNHDDANDLTQETFIKVWNSLDKFRGESNLYTWIYRIATNEVLAFIEKEKNRRNLSIDDNVAEVSRVLSSDIYFDGDEAQLKLQQALATLPAKQRMVFNMKYFDDMKYEDMSQILDTSVGALKASYHIAVEKIQKFLETN